MVGYPSHLNTREDYDYVVANFSKDQYVQDFQNLLDTRYDFQFDHYMEDDETVDLLDGNHRILMEEVPGQELPKRALYTKVYVSGNRMEQLGYTEEEVLAIING